MNFQCPRLHETALETEAVKYESDKTVTVWGDDYEIKAHFTDASKVPAGSTVQAKEITNNAAASEYLDKAEKAVDLTASADQKVTGRFFDITIVDPEGKEVEPAGPVEVTITCKSGVADNLRSDPKVVHFEDNQNTKVPEEVSVDKTTSSKGTDTVKFQAESFSVYGVVYTVDYTYKNCTYNMTGSASMLLSDLMAKLGVDGFDVSKVESVTFTNENLVKVEKNDDGDYTVTSLQPFSSQEQLTVTMSDGVVYKIAVTDASEVDLSDYLTGFKAYTQTNDQEKKWVETKTVTDGDSVAFDINFTVPSGALTSDQRILTFDVSDGKQITRPNKGSSGKVKQQGVEVGEYTIDADGKVKILQESIR